LVPPNVESILRRRFGAVAAERIGS